ncbi:hypothetical protein [Agrobacterium tumefaciens]|uniref:hypothetical protein n=1 Tax=Agrobacterium tumefaciens TaxID=358 RepID=UPI001574BB5D|nr:hypothetical protein [Agrobacterium tumefaciens]WCJ63939.1 hypothetical protein G6M15_07060 [Agrobacterium tumefaciens]
MKYLSSLLALALVAILSLAPAIAEAKSVGGFRGGSSFRSSSFSSRSYSRPSTSYSRPSSTYSRPAPAYRPSTTYNSSTTVIQQQRSGGGGGFFSGMFGGLAGYWIGSQLFGDDKPAEPAPAPTPAVPTEAAPSVPAEATPAPAAEETPKAE